MQSFTSVPLVPPHISPDHPLASEDYSLFTVSINEMATTVGGWLDDRVDGGVIYGPSRFGKSSGVDNWLRPLLSQRFGGYVPLVIWSHIDSGAQSVGRFHAHLLLSSRHELAKATRSSLDRQHMLVERWAELALQGGGRFLVLVIDEAQHMTQREWLWMVELHSLMDKERIRLCVFAIASLQFFDEPVGMALSGGAHVASRFMLVSEPFHGVRNVEELRYVLSGYDLGTEWPPKSGISYTQGVASSHWEQGFRMEDQADSLWQALQDELPGKYAGPIEFPMKTIAKSARHVLLRIAGGADPEDVGSLQSWRSIVAGTGHRTLMAIVTAAAPRLSRHGLSA